MKLGKISKTTKYNLASLLHYEEKDSHSAYCVINGRHCADGTDAPQVK